MQKIKIKKQLRFFGLCIGSLLIFSASSFAQQMVKGKLISSSGEALSGATVQVKGTNKSVLTGANGEFTIAVPLKSTLVFSYVGHTDKEIVVSGSEINEVLQRSNDNLNDVVVIGYQSVKRKDLTGAVDVINVNDAKKVTATTVAEALQGLAAGVNVRTSGQAGSEAVIEIRGNGSLLNNNPMYVIDGLPLTTANRDFNPSDIESIQILKDASAAAIYGSRAANGVIIITTKKGKEGPMKISFSAKAGSENIKRFHLAGPAEWIALNKESYDNSGTPYMQGVATYGQPGNTANTDWQKQVLRQGNTQDYNLGFSGGGVNSSYFISGSYFNNTGSIINSSFERETFRINTESRKGKFKIGENFIFSNAKENIPQGNPLGNMLTMLPIMPVYDSTNVGGYATGNQNFFTSGQNPVANNGLSTANSTNVRIKGNAFAELKLLPWITYRFNVGLEVNWSHYKQFNKPGRVSKDLQFGDAALVESRDQAWNIISEHTLNFIKDFGVHHINGVAGFNFQQDNYSNILSNGTGYNPIGGNTYLPILTQATSTFASGNINKWAARSFFGRLNYNYKDRYLLSATVRNESDSRFGTGHKNATFPAISGAWNIAKEKFFNSKTVNLKLRASYGSLGNVTVAPWQYLATANSTIRFLFSGTTPLIGAIQTVLVHPDLRWETDNTTDVGVDGSVLNNAISFTLDYFVRTSKNVLTLNSPIPAYLTGNSNPPYPAVNAASLENKGLEASITYRNNNKAFKFDITANITSLRNKLLALGENNLTNYVQKPLTRSQIGRSLGEYYLLQSDGIFQTQEQIDSYVDKNGNKIQPTAVPGNQKFIQRKTSGVTGITSDDRTFRGSPWPKLQTGLILNASYKNFSFNMIWYGSFGNKLYNGSKAFLQNLQNNNAYQSGIKPWTPQNTNTDIPMAYFGAGTNSSPDASLDMIGINDRWLEDGSFVRLRNIELSYAIAPNALKFTKIDNARVFISGQNLITITKYTGLDPEVANPDIFSRGVDNIRYPANRIVSAGIQLNF